MSEFILFDLITVFYDKDGNELQSIQGRRNRYNNDSFYIGNQYPSLSDTVIKQWQHDGQLLIEFDINSQRADAIINKSNNVNYTKTYKVIKDRKKFKQKAKKLSSYNFQDFSPTRLNTADMEILLRQWNQWK